MRFPLRWLVLAAAVFPCGVAAGPLCGDLNQNGVVGSVDALALRQHLAGLQPLGPIASSLCDVIDEPGVALDTGQPAARCTMADAVVLARASSSLPPDPLPVCPLASSASCFVEHTGRGCDEPPVALCVCDQDVECCTLEWNAACAALAATDGCRGVKILATGDTGEGNADQYAVGAAMDSHCAAVGGCDAVILTGDNFYDDGVDSVNDPQWLSKFELPYDLPGLFVPFYAVFGNHDYGPTSSGNPLAQIDYSLLPVGTGPGERFSGRWSMPGPFFDVVVGDDLVHLFFLDTQSWLPFPDMDDQLDDMQGRVASSTATWKISVGHHPRYTSGDHQLDNELLDELTQLINPPGMFELQEGVYCGTDLYLSGHDHDREFIDRGQDRDCPDTHFAISGAGSKVRESAFPPVRRQRFYDDQVEGFAYMAFSSRALQFEFYDKHGTLDFCRLIAR
jgi:hypothetical protein